MIESISHVVTFTPAEVADILVSHVVSLGKTAPTGYYWKSNLPYSAIRVELVEKEEVAPETAEETGHGK